MTVSAVVPNAFPVAIDGHEFLVDLERYESASIEVIRQQADGSSEFGEQSLNPLDLWRRSVDDWRFGSGQRWLDRSDSVRQRFFESYGVNPWDRGELKLANNVADGPGFTTAGSRAVRSGNYIVTLHPTDNNRLIYIAPDFTFTTSHALVGEVIRDFASDGLTVYIATDQNVYKMVDVGQSSTALTLAVNVNLNPKRVWFALGRILFAQGPELWNIIGDPNDYQITPSFLPDDWVWTAAGSSDGSVYVSGDSGDGATSVIYKSALAADGTKLNIASVAAPLPTGEQCLDILEYVGVVALGTTRGIRLATPTQAGHLQYGPLAETPYPVRAMEASGRFLWFGQKGGVGRMDLSTFIPDRLLASPYTLDDYAIDPALDVTGVVALENGGRLGFVGGNTVFFSNASTHVLQGQVRSGKLTFGLPDRKALEKLQIRCEPLPAGTSVDWAVEADGVQVASGTLSGTGTTGFDPEVSLGGAACDSAELILTLKTTNSSVTPLLYRWTLRAHPMPRAGLQFSVPLILREDVTGLNGRRVQMDPEAEYTFLLSLLGKAVTFQEAGRTRRAYLDQVRRGPELSLTKRNDGFQGTATVVLRSFDQ